MHQTQDGQQEMIMTHHLLCKRAEVPQVHRDLRRHARAVGCYKSRAIRHQKGRVGRCQAGRGWGQLSPRPREEHVLSAPWHCVCGSKRGQSEGRRVGTG